MDIRKKLALIINCIIALDTFLVAMIGIVFGAGQGQLGTYIIGLGYLKPYTMDSNILTGIVAILVVIHILRNKNEDYARIPRWLMNAYLMAATSLMLTFLTAALFLAPGDVMSGRSYFAMFSGDMFFFHLVNPVLAAVSFVALLNGDSISARDRIIGMIPTIIYSFVYLLMVAVLKCWEDFYNFTFGGNYYLIPAVFIIIYSVAYMSAYLLTRVHNYFANKDSN